MASYRRSGETPDGTFSQAPAAWLSTANYVVMPRRTDGRVLAADIMLVEQRHELWLGALAVRQKALHDERDVHGIDAGQKTVEDVRNVGFPAPELRVSQP